RRAAHRGPAGRRLHRAGVPALLRHRGPARRRRRRARQPDLLQRLGFGAHPRPQRLRGRHARRPGLDPRRDRGRPGARRPRVAGRRLRRLRSARRGRLHRADRRPGGASGWRAATTQRGKGLMAHTTNPRTTHPGRANPTAGPARDGLTGRRFAEPASFAILALLLAAFPLLAPETVVNVGVYALIYGIAAIGLTLLMG